MSTAATAIASLDDQTINELQQFTQQQRGKDLKLISGDSKADDIDRWVMSDWLVTFLEVLREDTPGALRLEITNWLRRFGMSAIWS
jgi:hypothetical protein